MYSDKELRKYAFDFFTDALNSICKSNQELAEAMASWNFRMANDKVFKLSPEIIRSLGRLIQRCIKLLGTTSGHEADMERIAWSIASSVEPGNIQKAIKEFTVDVEEQSATKFIFIAPNFAVELMDNIKELEVGPVKIRMSETLPDNYVKPDDKVKWIVHITNKPKTELSSHGFEISYPRCCWEVRLAASPGNAEEEAHWLINIALSCIRMSYPVNHNNDFYPNIGKKEAHPIETPIVYNPRIVMRAENRSFNISGARPNLYTIDKKILQHFRAIDFKRRSNVIFNSEKNTVAERVAHGLGWMTRGRHAEDRSERFLFFYTAIEALVSTGDKTAPVIQTIARNAASILDDRPEVRRNIATEIIDSYGIRSALVHGGRRQVSYTESYKAQLLAEKLYDAVIENIDLSKTNERFEKDLKEASYGLPFSLDM